MYTMSGVTHVFGTRTFLQFTIEATSIAIELIVKAAAPQRSVSGIIVRALGLDTSRSGVGSRLVTGETCTGEVGGASVQCLDTQGRPLVRLGVDSGEGGNSSMAGVKGVRGATCEKGDGVVGVSVCSGW